MTRISRYFRISITNLCNLSCYYCHNEGQNKTTKNKLTVEEIIWISRIASQNGFCKFKLTGGEPTLRSDICEIVSRMRTMNIEDLSLITNGTLLYKVAKNLWDAGLPRLNVSLHTLDKEKFRKEISPNTEFLDRIVEGIDTAISVGFKEIKLNFVYHGTQSLDDYFQICDFAADRNLIIVLLPLLLINKKKEDEKTPLQQLYLILKNLGIKKEEFVVDNEGLEKRLITLKSGVRILLRKNELTDILPYEKCSECTATNDCREGIFPIRLQADGSLLPCLAGGLAKITLSDILLEKNEYKLASIFQEFTGKEVYHAG